MEFKDRLKKWRETNDLSLAHLAAECGLGEQAVRKWELGQSAPRAWHLEALEARWPGVIQALFPTAAFTGTDD